jgi:hypothetical protein
MFPDWRLIQNINSTPSMQEFLTKKFIFGYRPFTTGVESLSSALPREMLSRSDA